MSSTWLFRFKERERHSREGTFKRLLLKPVANSPSACFMSLFCTSGWWKNQIGHTAPLLTFLDVCSNTQPAPSLSAGKKGKKNKPHQKSITIRGTWQAAGAEQEPREEVKNHSLGRGWSLEKSRDSIFTTSPILEARSKHRIGIIWSLGDCVSQLFLAEFL